VYPNKRAAARRDKTDRERQFAPTRWPRRGITNRSLVRSRAITGRFALSRYRAITRIMRRKYRLSILDTRRAR